MLSCHLITYRQHYFSHIVPILKFLRTIIIFVIIIITIIVIIIIIYSSTTYPTTTTTTTVTIIITVITNNNNYSNHVSTRLEMREIGRYRIRVCYRRISLLSLFHSLALSSSTLLPPLFPQTPPPPPPPGFALISST